MATDSHVLCVGSRGARVSAATRELDVGILDGLGGVVRVDIPAVSAFRVLLGTFVIGDTGSACPIFLHRLRASLGLACESALREGAVPVNFGSFAPAMGATGFVKDARR